MEGRVAVHAVWRSGLCVRYAVHVTNYSVSYLCHIFTASKICRLS